MARLPVYLLKNSMAVYSRVQTIQEQFSHAIVLNRVIHLF